MKNTILYLLIAILILGACDDEDSNDNDSKLEPINFFNMQVGQKSIFEYFRGKENWGGMERSIEYTGDTLWVEVIRKSSDNIFRIKEHNSLLKIGITPPYIEYDIELSNNQIKLDSMITEFINEPSVPIMPEFLRYYGFYDHGNYLNLEKKDSLISFDGWMPEYNELSVIGKLDNFSGKYQDLDDVYIHINFGSMAVDGPGTYHIFDIKKGLIRNYEISAWTSDFNGIELIN